MMNKLLQMRPIELDYKDFYQNSGQDIFSCPMELSEFRQIIRDSSPKYHHLYLGDFYTVLKEDAFFQNYQDITASQHYRYMPATYHEHDFFELACVLSGSFHNYIGKQDLLMSAGDIIIISPHTPHAVCAYRDDAVMVNILIRASTFHEHFMNVLPDNDLLQNFFVKTLYRPSDTPYLFFRTGEDADLTRCILNLTYEFSRNKMYKNTMLVALASIFLVTLLRKHEKDVVIPTIHPSIMNENIIFILQYMQNNYATITLSHLASFFNYSERQMQRIITSATGCSFSENIKKLRMKHALTMLQDQDLSVTDIAETLGYYDASNFRHVFKSFYHMTPQEYRNSLLAGKHTEKSPEPQTDSFSG